MHGWVLRMFCKSGTMAVKRGIDKAVRAISEQLGKDQSYFGNRRTPVATISPTMIRNRLILSAIMVKVGKDGVFTVEEAKGIETSLV
jgi:chaperonin GroEL